MTDKARDPRALNSVKGAAPATAQIQMRVIPEVKNCYVAQAQREGMKLSEWIQYHLNAVCEKAETDRQWAEKASEKTKFFRVYRKNDRTWRMQYPDKDRFGQDFPRYTTDESQAGFFGQYEISTEKGFGRYMSIQDNEELIPYTPSREEFNRRSSWES